MKLTSYQHSFLKKMSLLFYGKTISDVILITDEDGDLVDNVRFFEVDFHDVVGFYMNGANPLISRNHIDEFDDFNLYALYSALNENKDGAFIPFRVDFINVFFHPEYSEVISIFLASSDFSLSVFIVFSIDEIHIYTDCSVGDLTKLVKEKLTQFNDVEFFTCQIGVGDDKLLCT